MRTLLRCRWLATMQSDVIEDGAVLIRDAVVVAAGRYVDVVRENGRADERDLGDCVLLPALVNAHTHLELTDCTQGDRPLGGLEGWLTRMLARTRVSQAELDAKSASAAVDGAQQCIRFGVATVGDISRQCHVTRPALQGSPLRITSFGEVMAMAQRRELLEGRVEIAADPAFSSLRLRIGISPHSPYSIELDGYRRCLQVACENGLPLSTHLAESPNEAEFLAKHSGPLKALWDAWLTWDDHVPFFEGGPIRFADSLGLLAYPAVLAHVNYCDDEEMAILARGQASVVYCPRTHEFFSHPPHRFPDMMRAGINVAVGTDSTASSPDLNVVEDLRLIHRLYPEMSAAEIWKMATVNGAEALAMGAAGGRIAAGAPADLVAFASGGPDPLATVLETNVLPRYFCIAGAELK